MGFSGLFRACMTDEIRHYTREDESPNPTLRHAQGLLGMTILVC